jgi:hypothetical protein
MKVVVVPEISYAAYHTKAWTKCWNCLYGFELYSYSPEYS